MDGQVALRTFFAALFVLSLSSKARRPARFVAGVREYALVPDRLTPLVALLIGTADATLAVMLLLTAGPLPWVETVALLSVFCAAQAWSIGRGRQHACHCFGGDEPVGPLSLGRSLSLGLVALAVLAHGGPMPAVGIVGPDVQGLAYVAAVIGAACVASTGSIPARLAGRRRT